MDNKEKKYVHFNPTQINNYGTSENSVQTVHKNIKYYIDNTTELLDGIVKGLNSFWSLIFKSIGYYILIAIIPAIICIFLGGFGLHLLSHPNASMGMYISNIVHFGPELFNVIPFAIQAFLPLAVIIGSSILFLIMVTYIWSFVLYKDDNKKRDEFFKAMITTQLVMYLLSWRKK